MPALSELKVQYYYFLLPNKSDVSQKEYYFLRTSRPEFYSSFCQMTLRNLFKVSGPQLPHLQIKEVELEDLQNSYSKLVGVNHTNCLLFYSSNSQKIPVPNISLLFSFIIFPCSPRNIEHANYSMRRPEPSHFLLQWPKECA